MTFSSFNGRTHNRGRSQRTLAILDCLQMGRTPGIKHTSCQLLIVQSIVFAYSIFSEEPTAVEDEPLFVRVCNVKANHWEFSPVLCARPNLDSNSNWQVQSFRRYRLEKVEFVELRFCSTLANLNIWVIYLKTNKVCLSNALVITAYSYLHFSVID